MMRLLVLLLFCAVAPPASAQDVWVLGEVHDNPDHHRIQAEMTADIAPAALVFEMLEPGMARRALTVPRNDPDALRAALDWDESGWPDFAMYYPIFAAAPEAGVYGAEVPRRMITAAMQDDPAAAFGPDAGDYGLTEPLSAPEQAAREARQRAAHCDALPEAMLPVMVELQRLRDAALARAARRAYAETGGPVVVITGNGHARRDWGMPALLARAAPELEIMALGQGEDGVPPEGVFDRVTDAPRPARGDPCEAFR